MIFEISLDDGIKLGDASEHAVPDLKNCSNWLSHEAETGVR
jgi:hypothetical protein